ncbi:hypothetical protein BX666DRAFT_988460 [Dichotomocladium elegans]|nr:hypothetical protein BX666DRAFT_988460 [Dichotomocladium elegans]
MPMSKYWDENPCSTWSLLNYDMALIHELPDVTKDQAHHRFSEELKELATKHADNSEIIAQIRSMQKHFKKCSRDEIITNFWLKEKAKVASGALTGRIRDEGLSNAAKETIRVALEQNAVAGSARMTAEAGSSDENSKEAKSKKRRRLNPFKYGGHRSSNLYLDHMRWVVEGVDVSEEFMELREKILQKSNHESITSEERLIANFIFYICERYEESTSRVLGRGLHKAMFRSLDIREQVTLPSYTSTWLAEMEVNLRNAKEPMMIKKLGIDLLGKALDKGQFAMNLADIVYRLLVLSSFYSQAWY